MSMLGTEEVLVEKSRKMTRVYGERSRYLPRTILVSGSSEAYSLGAAKAKREKLLRHKEENRATGSLEQLQKNMIKSFLMLVAKMSKSRMRGESKEHIAEDFLKSGNVIGIAQPRWPGFV